jgi:hypothetical protein
MDYKVLVTNFMLPVNLNRIIDSIAGRTDLKSKDELNAKYIVDTIEDMTRNEKTTMLCMSTEERKDLKSFKNRDEQEHKWVLKTALYDSLNPKRMLFDLNFSKKQFDAVVEEIIMNFNRNIIEPGEMAGIVAAQSTGEPLFFSI